MAWCPNLAGALREHAPASAAMMLKPLAIKTGTLRQRFRSTSMGSCAVGLGLLLCAASGVGCTTALEQGGESSIEHPFHVSVLAGSTIEEDESALSLGLDVEVRLSPFLGVSAVVERAFGDIDGTLVLGAADLHLTDHFIVQTGPGVDFVDGEVEAAFRIGTLYELERGGYTISPQIHYDWTSGEDAVVVGVALGVGF